MARISAVMLLIAAIAVALVAVVLVAAFLRGRGARKGGFRYAQAIEERPQHLRAETRLHRVLKQ